MQSCQTPMRLLHCPTPGMRVSHEEEKSKDRKLQTVGPLRVEAQVMGHGYSTDCVTVLSILTRDWLKLRSCSTNASRRVVILRGQHKQRTTVLSPVSPARVHPLSLLKLANLHHRQLKVHMSRTSTLLGSARVFPNTAILKLASNMR